MSPLTTGGENAGGKSYWRSLDELADSPEFRKFVQNEFPAHADEMLEPGSRRTFLKIMGASLALAGMTACRWPSEQILPFTQRPEGYTPGEPMHFATAQELGGAAFPILATSFDGRPVKIEGNPGHPASLGATNARTQAAVLGLYDPDRSRNVVRLDGGTERPGTWEEFEKSLRPQIERLRKTGGAGLAVLSESNSSPTFHDLHRRFLREFPSAGWYEYEPLSRDNDREGARLAFGRPMRTQLALDRADVIVSIDDDFLFEHPDAVRYARDFVSGRKPETGRMNRLYVLESAYSLTGSMADHRIPVQPRLLPVAAACIGARLTLDRGLELPVGSGKLKRMLEFFQVHPMYGELGNTIAEELYAARGRSLIVAGPRQPPAIHAMVHLLNLALGNTGRTVFHTTDSDPDRPHHVDAIRELAAEINAERVDTLLVLGGNPVYDAPADLEFGSLLDSVSTSIHLGLYKDETSRRCGWHLPQAHFLESWGDGRDWRGSLNLVQPLIEPLFGGRSAIEVLSILTGEESARGYDLVRQRFLQGRGERDWQQALHDGWVDGTEPAARQPTALPVDWEKGISPYLESREGQGDLDLVFLPSPGIYDGRFANNGWLQELPEPLTKLTWNNAALIGPETARELGVWQEDLVEIRAGRRSVVLPVYVMPGQAASSIAVHIGYGRTAAGRVGDGVGVDVQALRTAAAMGVTAVHATPVPGKGTLATTQNHYAIDPLGSRESDERSRDLVREMEAHDYLEALEHGHHEHHPHEAPLWKQFEYNGYRWGMSIDLNSCTGCNSCIVACQAENNIPIVGPEEVARGREMHWLRVDRYFSGEENDPAISHQPLTCQHCENAPCEQVCPVAATVHDSDGVNLMVYNRCVGTRYCMNNCPYKVRRFNYFNNHKSETQLEMMIYNPDVSVRARGVMEKCSFCIQRISAAKIRAKNEKRAVGAEEFTTACAQACPTRAIAFGDLNNEDSRVHDDHKQMRAYSLLEWTDVKPRTRYLTRLRNRRDKDPSSGAL